MRRAALVIPVWNEGERLLQQLHRLRPYLDQVDVILADGESTDGSTERERLRALGVFVCLSTPERGLGRALQLGIGFALEREYDFILTMDGNGKDGVDAIPRFLAALKSGYDFVQGSRFMEGGESLNLPAERRLGIRYLIRPLMGVASGFAYTDPTNGFKGFRRRVFAHPELKAFRPALAQFGLQFYLNYQLPRLGFRTTEIPVHRAYPAGKTPTKIVGLRPRLRLLRDLLTTCLGLHDPLRH